MHGFLFVVILMIMMQERLFIGTPGSYYWQGQGYSMNLLNRYHDDYADGGDDIDHVGGNFNLYN